MPSCNTYCLTWVSLTLDVGYLFTAAPTKRSRCSLPWTGGIFSLPPLLTLNARAATAPWTWGSSSWPPPQPQMWGSSSWPPPLGHGVLPAHNHDSVITHLEPDILECEVKWALENITTNKASGGDGIAVELFQILKDDAVKVLHSICQQIWKTQQWPQDWKRSVFIPIPKKGNVK